MIFQRWLVQAQFEMSFEEFKNKLRIKPEKKTEEVLSDVESILKGWEVENGII